MTQKDHHIIFTALGFLVVILRDDVLRHKEALRATSSARLIESFCIKSVPDSFASEHIRCNAVNDSIKHLIERYITKLRDEGSSDIFFDRETLLGMYEVLLTQEMRHMHKEFYESAHDDTIASRVLQLAHEKIELEAQ